MDERIIIKSIKVDKNGKVLSENVISDKEITMPTDNTDFGYNQKEQLKILDKLQQSFLEEVNKLVLSTPNNLGAGIFWWEPATYQGRSSRDFFDTEGNALPVIKLFDMWTRK